MQGRAHAKIKLKICINFLETLFDARILEKYSKGRALILGLHFFFNFRYTA